MEQNKDTVADFIEKRGKVGKSYKDIVLTDEIYNRWQQLGLLECVESDDVKKKLAISLERLASYLIYEYEIKSTRTEVDVFPCMVRIIRLTNDELMPEKIVDIVDKLFNRIKFDENKEKFNDIVGNDTIDFEAELVALISDAYVGELIRDGEYKLVKVKENKEE